MLLLHELFLILFVNPLQLMRDDREDTPRIVVVFRSHTRIEISILLPIMFTALTTPHVTMTSRPAVAAAKLTLDRIVLGEDAIEGVDFFNVVGEGFGCRAAGIGVC